jgi:putative membrane protein insertion efficiency factor
MGVQRGEPGGQLPLIIDGDCLPTENELKRLVRENQSRQTLPVELPPLASLSRVRRAAIACIRFYQQHLSAKLDRTCVFEPSCSRYAEFAIAHNGVVRGSIATWKRLRRCRPENEGHIDYPKGVSVAVPDSQHWPSL